MSQRLKNKYALVTGASGSIGNAISQRFQKEGAIVTALDMQLPENFDTNISCDLSNPQDIEKAETRILQSAPYFDIFVHCAAMSDLAETTHVRRDTFSKLMDVNVYSAMQLTSMVAPGMKANQKGSILLISSITGLIGAPGMAAYAASKGALHTAARTLALELADSNIRVNTVSPASIDTPMLRDKFAQQPDPELARSQNIARHPLKRLGTPEDVANLTLFLSSDEACWITGCDYRIDGGATINRK